MARIPLAGLAVLAAILTPAIPAQAQDQPVSCLIVPWETISLAAPTQGVVAEVLAERGQSVKAGDLLVRLDDTMQATYLATVKAKAEDDTGLQQAEVKLDIANASLARNKPLFNQKLIKGDEWDQITGTAKLDAIDVDAAKQALVQAQLEVARAQAAVDQTRIRAPADAVVIDVMVSAGEAAGTAPLASLAIIDPLKVELFVKAASYAQWKVGQTVDLRGSQAPETTLNARVKSVDPVADAGTGVVRVQLELPNPGLKILAGQQCGLGNATAPSPQQ